MHILLITHYYEPDSGAAAVRLSRLAKLLHAQGHQITVLTTMPHYPAGEIDAAYRGKWSTDDNRAGIRVIQVWYKKLQSWFCRFVNHVLSLRILLCIHMHNFYI